MPESKGENTMKKRIQKYLAGEREGFSLVELIIVIAIMAILIGVIALAVIPNIQRSRESKDISFLDSVASATNAAIANNQITDSGSVTLYTDTAGDGKLVAATPAGTDAEKKIVTAVQKTIAQDPTLGSSAATTNKKPIVARWTIESSGAAKIHVFIGTLGSADDGSGDAPEACSYLSEPEKFEVNN